MIEEVGVEVVLEVLVYIIYGDVIKLNQLLENFFMNVFKFYQFGDMFKVGIKFEEKEDIFFFEV